MFRIIQIDPDTLAIRINASAIASHRKSDLIFKFIDLLSLYGPIDALNIMQSQHGYDKDVVSFASSVVHELRHFADLLLTPFGFYRIRTAFEFYTNFPRFIFGSNDTIPVPLMSAMDPVTRTVIGLNDSFEGSGFHQIGRTALTRVRVINSENEFDEHTGAIKIGSDRILEALAYITQFEYILNNFDVLTSRSRFPEFFAPFTGTEFDLAYRWFTPDVHKLHPNEAIPNNRLIQSILFSSMCGFIPVLGKFRNGGIQPSVVPSRDISEKLPSSRYYKLIEYFKAHPRSSLKTDSEAFEIVNTASKELFGLDLFSEIEMDINYTSDFITRIGEAYHRDEQEVSHFDSSKALEQINIYRKSIFEKFKKNPILFTSTEEFVKKLANFLKPSLIYEAPQGLPVGVGFPSAIRSSWIGLIDRTLNKPPQAPFEETATETFVYSLWSPIKAELGHQKGISDVSVIESGNRLDDIVMASLQIVYGIYSPLYRWLLYGNKSRSMLEVETDKILEALALDCERVVFDPLYRKAADISLSNAFVKFYQRENYYCDICGKKVNPEQGFIVSGRTIRQNGELSKYYKEIDELIYFELIEKDWSNWFVCYDDMLKWHFPIPNKL